MSENCLNCTERKLYCHDSCDRYAKMKQDRQLIIKKHRQFMDGWGYDGCLSPKRTKFKICTR